MLTGNGGQEEKGKRKGNSLKELIPLNVKMATGNR